MGLWVATWNVNHRGQAVVQALGELLRSSAVDLVLLQEANPNSLDPLRVSAGMDWAVTAFDGGAPFHTGRSGRRRGAALAGKGEPPHDVGILPDLALP